MKRIDKGPSRKPNRPREVWGEIFLIYGILIAALIWNWW
jgi:hypothetical protein